MKTISTNKDFQDILNSGQEVMIKFQANWCPDCRRMDMFIDPIVEQYQQYEWYDIDRDELPEIAEQFDVRGIPSLLRFKNGEKLAHLHSANAKSPEQVTEFLEAQKA
ncbi:thioredoxin family protein [Paenisporosarcina cavernae]|uniref:Thioredoxin n=1 Tax=Paenisporosarcina cavernae TaxID=2320858 RepID=A0A385YTB0_9BACL|nr:thioredoxin family protein [Paenisporosarcina cavernae]AYC30059.1 thioredoxin [Paenisporosarcina cavernae]